MNKPASIIIVIMGLIIITGGWYLYSTPRASVPVVPSTPLVLQETAVQAISTASMTASVKYTAKGFTPDPIIIRQGGTVTFESVDGSPMWVASNAHPTHLQYDGTSRTQHCSNIGGVAFDQCASGKTYSFKFLKVGDWNYHNHLNADDGGTITVVR